MHSSSKYFTVTMISHPGYNASLSHGDYFVSIRGRCVGGYEHRPKELGVALRSPGNRAKQWSVEGWKSRKVSTLIIFNIVSELWNDQSVQSNSQKKR